LTLVNLAAAGAMQIQACGVTHPQQLICTKAQLQVQCFSQNRAGKLFPAEVHPWLMTMPAHSPHTIENENRHYSSFIWPLGRLFLVGLHTGWSIGHIGIR